MAPASPEPLTMTMGAPSASDVDWIVRRHGELYANEHGWNAEFEALVANVVASFTRCHDPTRETAWIARLDGVPVGCVFCVRQDDAVAKLRLLLVEPRVRGRGLGTRLVGECIAFARAAGYVRLTLWTAAVLVDARRIYEHAGFQLIDSETHRSFGHTVTSQTWALDL